MVKSVKKMLSLVLIFVLVMTATIIPVSASVPVFSDIEGHWGQSAIEVWNGYGVVSGSNGKFRPDDAVSRAEFATMINNIMKYIEEGENHLSDITPDNWYYDAM